MGRPRKRKAPRQNGPAESKKRKVGGSVELNTERRDVRKNGVEYPVLSCYYDEVLTLRNYFLSRLSQQDAQKFISAINRLQNSDGCTNEDVDKCLDTVLVGVLNDAAVSLAHRRNDLTAFSQQLQPTMASTIGNDVQPDDRLQREVCYCSTKGNSSPRWSTFVGRQFCYMVAFPTIHWETATSISPRVRTCGNSRRNWRVLFECCARFTRSGLPVSEWPCRYYNQWDLVSNLTVTGKRRWFVHGCIAARMRSFCAIERRQRKLLSIEWYGHEHLQQKVFVWSSNNANRS